MADVRADGRSPLTCRRAAASEAGALQFAWELLPLSVNLAAFEAQDAAMIFPLFQQSTFALALVFAGLLTSPAQAQMNTDEDEMQRCVWQCLYHNPGASNPRYHACVKQMCETPQTPPSPRSAVVPRAQWKYGAARSGEHFAGVDVPGGSLTYLCRPDGSGLVGVGGIGGSGAKAELRVDGRPTGLHFSPRGSALFADLRAGASIPRALMGGRTAEVRDTATGRALTFPLGGSAATIAKAMKGCGIAH
ncbi:MULTISPECIES: hypothetical protein [unclassified Haematobacter]|uniref:hypothetical protein n=1 Tax=unclassified Haematobacter TaxID=2640585 RepID=UPI0025BC07FC|nr:MULTISPECIES: hypothetical protein [unclassified Haematobacter]